MKLNPPKHGEVGIMVPSGNNDDNIKYVLGVIVENFDKTTEDMTLLEIPEATYAVFTTAPVDGSKDNKNADEDFVKSINDMWQYIFEDWFKDSGYEYDEDKLDFEFYDERCHSRPDTVMEIFVPIKKIDK